MSLEAMQDVLLDNTGQNGTSQEVQMENISPSISARVQEPDGSDGSVYDIELLAQITGSSIGDDSHRLAACTLLIGAPVGKIRNQRVVDGKIENLWLKDEESAGRLNNIKMLATLLSYLQHFCANHEVPHLSSIQKVDHPAWLRDFFSIAGFNRCECLKPEAGGQRYRACLRLDETGKVDEPNTSGNPLRTTVAEAKENIPEAETGKVDEPNTSGKPLRTTVAEAKENILEAETGKVDEPNTSGSPLSTTIAKAKENLPEAKITPSPKDKATGLIIPSLNGLSASKAEDEKKTMTDDHALLWLSQNNKILSPTTSSGPTALPAPTASQTPTKTSETTSTNNSAATEKDDNSAGAKRKRDATAGSQDTEVPERNNRSRNDHKVQEEGAQMSGDGARSPKSKPSAKPPTKPLQSSDVKKASTVADRASSAAKSSEGQAKNGANITDALLAECDKKAPTKPIKKETPTAQSVYSLPPSLSLQRAQNLPPKHITCYYWYTQGSCRHRDEDCMYAHYETSNVARPPGSYKTARPWAFGQYDGSGDSWSDVNNISIKGGAAGAPAGPRADREYDSYRPR